MITLLSVLSILVPNTDAQTPNSDCQSHLLFEVDRFGVYFNRWKLEDGRELSKTLHEAIDAHTDRTRPLLILDTNPNPEIWSTVNIIRPSADRLFPDRGYIDLTPDEKSGLFADFLDRMDLVLRSKVRPIFTIDHHFDSELLSTASTTPMLVDLLSWLDVQPRSAKVREFRAALADAAVLRDHSDADIVLSSFASTLVTKPDALARFGPLISRIAYYNDHAFLDEYLGPVEKAEVLIGYAVVRAYEDYIQRHRPGGFATALQQMPRTLQIVKDAARAFAGDRDPVRRFLDSDLGTDHVDEFRELYAIVAADWASERNLALQLSEMLDTGQGVRRVGSVLVLDFPLAPKAASGMSVLRLLRASDRPLVAGADVMVAVTRKPHDNGGSPLVHVKMRTLRKGIRFDHVVNQIRANEMGGGGRGCAAGMYSSAGRVITPEALEKDLEWLVDQLNR